MKSTLSNLAFGNVMAAAAKDYQKVSKFSCSVYFFIFNLAYEYLGRFMFTSILTKSCFFFKIFLQTFMTLMVIKSKERCFLELCFSVCMQNWGMYLIALMFQELLAQEKAQASKSINQEVDLDELMDVSFDLFLFFYLVVDC